MNTAAVHTYCICIPTTILSLLLLVSFGPVGSYLCGPEPPGPLITWVWRQSSRGRVMARQENKPPTENHIMLYSDEHRRWSIYIYSRLVGSDVRDLCIRSPHPTLPTSHKTIIRPIIHINPLNTTVRFVLHPLCSNNQTKKAIATRLSCSYNTAVEQNIIKYKWLDWKCFLFRKVFCVFTISIMYIVYYTPRRIGKSVCIFFFFLFISF